MSINDLAKKLGSGTITTFSQNEKGEVIRGTKKA